MSFDCKPDRKPRWGRRRSDKHSYLSKKLVEAFGLESLYKKFFFGFQTTFLFRSAESSESESIMLFKQSLTAARQTRIALDEPAPLDELCAGWALAE